MNYKKYYEVESEKTYWQRQRGLNRRLSGKRESWKKINIRANFEMEITKMANPKGRLFLAFLMALSLSIILVAFLIVILVELQYYPIKSNTDELVNGMMLVGLLGYIMIPCVFGIVTRRRRK